MLELRDVSYAYKQPVLQNITFTVAEGEFFGIIGPNGSGKTTLLRLIAGYLQSLTGEIFLNKKDILKYSYKERARKIAVVPQYHLVNQFFSVQQLLEMAREPYLGIFRRLNLKDHNLIQQIVEKLQLNEFKNRLLKTLSGGELQRVLIAKALIQDTPIIIMDEPTNHLDIHHQTEILNIVKTYQKQGKTIISVFHDLNYALKYCDRVLVLDKNIKALGSPEEVINKEILKSVFQTDDFFVNKDLRVVLK